MSRSKDMITDCLDGDLNACQKAVKDTTLQKFAYSNKVGEGGIGSGIVAQIIFSLFLFFAVLSFLGAIGFALIPTLVFTLIVIFGIIGVPLITLVIAGALFGDASGSTVLVVMIVGVVISIIIYIFGIPYLIELWGEMVSSWHWF